ncbi:MAG: hypothetical protein IKR93_04430 [Firmicutes bacterium]|nr:hypothetical protein [Bacillota bacterium]
MPDAHAKKNNLGTGLLYFYIHFVTEVICFFVLGRYVGTGPEIWIIFLLYDMLAFVPQAMIGYVSDKHRKLPLGLIGLVLLAAGLLLSEHVQSPFVSLVVLCLGNCCTHVSGAEVTLRSSKGRLSHSAIFVSGGSFGVITGQLLAKTSLASWPLLILAATAVPFVICARMFLEDADGGLEKNCAEFNYSKEDLGALAVIFMVVFIIIVRGYMGYGIPTSWKKTVWQTVLLFVTMGIGKAAGGILADRFGVRRVAVASALLALPFLILGDRLIVVSLTGVMFFSMTMSVTLALLVSVFPNHPGLAFGLTTIGLFLGTAPVFFFRFSTYLSNCILLCVLTAVSVGFMLFVIKREKRDAGV